MANKICDICNSEVDKTYPLRCPTPNNEDKTRQICISCHKKITAMVNDFIDKGGK